MPTTTAQTCGGRGGGAAGFVAWADAADATARAAPQARAATPGRAADRTRSGSRMAASSIASGVRPAGHLDDDPETDVVGRTHLDELSPGHAVVAVVSGDEEPRGRHEGAIQARPERSAADDPRRRIR